MRLEARAGVAMVLSLVLLQGCAGQGGGSARADGGEGEAGKREAIPVEVAPVERRAMSALYATSGTLRPDRTATVTARTRGVVERLLAEEGTRVESGMTLVVLEDDEQAIGASRAAASRDNQIRQFDRARALHEQGLLSLADFEAARREADEARHAADLADLALRRTVIPAPFSGMVVRRHLDVGATVADGTPLYDLADLDPLHADVNVPERHVARISPGQTVRLFPETSTHAVDAVIERIAPAVDAGTGTVKVTLAVPESTGLRPGSFARVEIVTDTRADALVVPRSALVAEGRTWQVFRLAGGTSTVEQVRVTTGFEEGDRVEILSSQNGGRPLSSGDWVVRTGASALSDGAPVTVDGRGAP